MTIIASLTPAAFLAQVRKQAAQSPRHIPNALMDSAARILQEWATDAGYTTDAAAYIVDCVAAGYSAAYASRNFTVIAYAATGAAQVEF